MISCNVFLLKLRIPGKLFHADHRLEFVPLVKYGLSPKYPRQTSREPGGSDAVHGFAVRPKTR